MLVNDYNQMLSGGFILKLIVFLGLCSPFPRLSGEVIKVKVINYCDKMAALPTSILSTENSIRTKLNPEAPIGFHAAVATGERTEGRDHRPVLRSPSVSDSRTLFMAPM